MNANELLESFSAKEGINTNKKIINWIEKKNNDLKVIITKTNLSNLNLWELKRGVIRNKNGCFFEICGLLVKQENNKKEEQPVIVQNEIGFLGIICKKINGIYHFLMQAKIEPGNINKIQISPTLQATKSNFELKHGGKKPKYLDEFINAEKHEIIIDQIQSEQSSRFFKKRNRNIIIDIKDREVEKSDSHMWMTLGQIKTFMKIDNLVNMDTRTVLSCLPFVLLKKNKSLVVNNIDSYFYNSIFNDDSYEIVEVYHKINNYKMFHSIYTTLCPLTELKEWKMINNEFVCNKKSNFKIIFCNLEIEGREVKKWGQPLFEATGPALFVLFMAKFDNKYKYLVKLMPESGSFDKVELGPTIQCEYNETLLMPRNLFEKTYIDHLSKTLGIKNNVLLSEEGGRFFCEQNRNVIVEINKDEIGELPDDYIWVDYKTLNLLQLANNVLNIQLRNLLSILEA